MNEACSVFPVFYESNGLEKCYLTYDGNRIGIMILDDFSLS